MKVLLTDDPKQVYVRDGYYYRAPGAKDEKWIEGECKILTSDVANAKEFAKELMKERDERVCQKWEHDYYKQMAEVYGSKQVAGALLYMVWNWTREKYVGKKDDDGGWSQDSIAKVAHKIKMQFMQNGGK